MYWVVTCGNNVGSYLICYYIIVLYSMYRSRIEKIRKNIDPKPITGVTIPQTDRLFFKFLLDSSYSSGARTTVGTTSPSLAEYLQCTFSNEAVS